MLLSAQRCFPRRLRWRTVFLGQILVLFLILLVLLEYGWDVISTQRFRSPFQVHHLSHPLVKQQAKFWRVLYQIILNNDPKCLAYPERVVPQKLDIVFDPSHQHPRPDILWMEAADIENMRLAHSNVVADLNGTSLDLVYNRGTRGIVMTAGLSQLPVLVVSVRLLRRTSCLLPVEVFLMSSAEYDTEICEKVLPLLNAKCLLFSNVFRVANTGISLDRFQSKIMAILFSSFDDFLLLDCDVFPIHDPTLLFNSEPFTTTKMILWPDFWYPSESPYYFQIADLGEPPTLDARPSTESGEIMYSKSRHQRSLMLVAYYNFYGPQYYYPLHSQGAPGQGDKETYRWAAEIMGESVYSVHEEVIPLGHLDSSGEYFSSAMVQHDPFQDWKHTTSNKTPANQSIHSDNVPITDNKSQSEGKVRPFFVHGNFPNSGPFSAFVSSSTSSFSYDESNKGGGSPNQDSNGTTVRSWLDEAKMVEKFGFDLERRFWEEALAVACEYESVFGCWREHAGICDAVKRYWNDVFGLDT